MKILVISAEVWRDDSNGGNVLSNIFDGFDGEFAQIYCNQGMPSNRKCKKYYQMTDSMIIQNVIKHKPIGKVLEFKEFPCVYNQTQIIDGDIRKLYAFFRKYSFPIFHAAKEILWNISKWENSALREFIVEFDPDIIFAPCYGSHIMLSIDRYVAQLTKKPVISYISDDHYSLKQFRFSIVYWINRFLLRKNLRKTFPYYTLAYTMTDEQREECQKAFKNDMKILRKGIEILQICKKENINKPIKLIYAGGIYCGRWKTLIAVVKALKEINKNGIKMVLDVYTGNKLTKKQQVILNDKVNSNVHGLITQDELKKRYEESDIALHVESFDLKNRLITRLSFSTKITDCLSSGCAVMAICWNGHSGYKYLEKEDTAICIDSRNKIYENLVQIVENPDIIKKYSEKAYIICKKNHSEVEVRKMIELDFKNLEGEMNNNEDSAY